MTKRTKRGKKSEATTIEPILPILRGVFKNNPFKMYGTRQLSSLIGYTSGEAKELMNEALQILVQQGLVDQLPNHKYKLKLAEEDVLTGVVDMTSSGTLYIKVEGIDRDILVESHHSAHALHGDTVRVVPIHRRRNGLVEGEIVEILERNERNYVGRIEITNKHAFVQVDNCKMPNDIFIPLREIGAAEDGDKVLVRIVEWPLTMKNPLGEIIDVLGKAGDNDTEMHAILAEYDLPYKYPEDVTAEAEKISEKITEKDYAERRDFRDVTTFTIDPKDAKDFDDALSIRQVKDEVWEVGVHIADVTHYVQPETILESEAQERATSVYLVDRTIPMLPERLSNYLCSLRPHEEKLAFSAVFNINERAEVIGEWFGRTVIYSDRRFTYEEAQEVIETGQGEYKDELLTLNTLARKLRKERFKNGSIGFERDETKFEINEKGKPVSVYFKVQKESNQLIEEFMLLANRKVAEFIGRKKSARAREKTFVYRIHDKPTPEKLDQFKAFITRFGYQMKAEKGRAVAKEMNKLLKDVQGKSEENLISTLAIRTMAKAVYSTENIGHYGLAFDYYTHFTSPIRRYPDMMVHRLLAHYLAGGKSEKKEFYENQCEHSSAMELRASDAERASIKYKMVEFMEDKIGNEFDGTISGVTEWGIYVELTETKIEGMVSMRDMTDDFYTFDDLSYSITGRVRRHSFTLGDPVRIRVRRADLQKKQLDFEMVGWYDFDSKKLTKTKEEIVRPNAVQAKKRRR